jgi:hypothetical protein
MMSEFLMFLRYSAEKGAVRVGAERSITLCWRLEIVPELVAWDAVEGSLRCRFLWCVMVTFVAFKRGGRCTPGPSSIPSVMFSSTLLGSSFDEESSRNVEIASDCVGVVNSCGCAPLNAEVVGAFLRDLKENFFGGLKELRVVCSFSESALIVYSRHFQIVR